MPTLVEIKRRLGQVFDERQTLVLAEVINDAYSDLVKTSDFNELKGIVKDIGVKVGELAEAQKNTEKRLDSLAVKVEQLAEAQKRTEEELKSLIKEHKETRRQLGGLSNAVGFGLEDRAFKALPKLLKRDFNIEIKERLKRKFVKTEVEGEYIEVNIIGKSMRNRQEIMVIGECKSQISKGDVDDFIRKKLKRLDRVYKEMFPILITYMISEPDVEEYTKKKGIALYYSYDFEE